MAVIVKTGQTMKPKLILCLALILSGALPAAVQAQFLFTAINGGITITGYTGPGGAIVIPETIDHLPVVSIEHYAFARRTSITSVVIPDSVTNIGDEAFTYMDTHSRLTKFKIGRKVARIGRGAFSACDQLTNITIPESVVSIGAGAFLFCSKLTVTTIPASVTNIEDGAFNACFSLKSIIVDASNPAYCSVDGVLYDKNRTRLLQFPGGKVGGYVIPNSVTNIAHFALWNCPYLTSVTMPDGINSIGDEEFAACGRLVTVIVPASVTSIGQNAFNSCVSMEGIYFRGNAPDYGEYWRGGRAKVLGGLDSGTVYYLRDTTGWETNFGGRPTALWNP
jgi:BspA type Leucine rich repeat region (6 copies)